MTARYLTLTFLGLSLFIAAPAWSRAFLVHAEPRVGSDIATAPKRIVLEFDQNLEAASSQARVEDAQGRPVDRGGSFVDPENRKRLILPLPSLSPGHYHVFWMVTGSYDGKPVQGDYPFTVGKE